MVRDLDLVGPRVEDARRLEMVADGLPLFGGATTLVSALRADGSADGVASEAALRKVRTHPELAGPLR